MNFAIKPFLYLPISLLFLFPLAFVAGPAILEIFSFLVIVSILIQNFFDKKKIYFFQNIVKFIFCFYLYIFFLSLFKNSLIEVFTDHFFYFRFLLFSICVCYLINTYPGILKNFLFFFLITYLFIITDQFYQFSFGKNLLGFEVNTVNRYSGMFGSELILGSYLSRLFPFLFGLIYISDLKNKKIILALISIVTVISVFISGERTALGLLFLSLFLIFIKKDLRKLSIYVIIFTTLLLTFISYFNKSQRYRIFIEPFHQMSLLKPMIIKKYSDVSTNYEDENLQKFHIFSEHHHEHYITAYNMFMNNILFGVGPDNFRVECNNQLYAFGKDPCSTHPHNLLLQILSETGLIGFIFFIIAFYYVLREILKRYNRSMISLKDELQYFILISFFINLWPFFPSGNLFNNWVSFIIYFPLGFYLYFSLKK